MLTLALYGMFHHSMRHPEFLRLYRSTLVFQWPRLEVSLFNELKVVIPTMATPVTVIIVMAPLILTIMPPLWAWVEVVVAMAATAAMAAVEATAVMVPMEAMAAMLPGLRPRRSAASNPNPNATPNLHPNLHPSPKPSPNPRSNPIPNQVSSILAIYTPCISPTSPLYLP